ncbi:MAG: NTP transferase domain-containing protein [Austwickia sp.]|jgi:CTP:molybdopterin cytidylyltransferase MocA|nr:MAG: NTP transferase domain-containing protein [Austwickia sp.]
MPKVLAEGGRWLDMATTALLRGGCAEVVVVLGAAVVPVPAPARSVVNEDWATGLGSSVRCALSELRKTPADLAVLHLVDLPDVGADVVRRVVAAAAATGIARASYHGVPGHPLAVHRRHWSAMAAHARADQGGRGWLQGRSDVVSVPCADLATGVDRDTPELLE